MANTLNLGNGNWGVKKDSLLAYNSENGNFKPLPFDFTRASSATVVNKAGLIETVGSGTPRIDFQGNTDGALLLEPQRSNLIPYSEDFSNSSWAKTNCAITPNNSISPDGTQNADKLDFTSSSGEINRSLIVNSGQEYILSFYAKTESGTLNFNYGNISYVIVGGIATTEWQRFEIVQTAAASTRFPKIQTTEIGSLLLYGFQVEQGSYPTSYIPTSGSAVTRVADACTNGGNDQVINSTEGVLYAEISALSSTSLSSKYISISDGTYNNRASILFSTGSTNQIRTFLRVGGGVQIDVNNSVNDVTDFNKIAFSYKENDFKVYINGSLVSSDTSGSVWSANTITKLSFSEINTSVNKFEGNVKDVRVYNTALTDSELAILTTI
jgi:hypothetical protein